jgi:ATP-dependent Clp protease ATP-binding subunit ClpX
MTNTATVEQCSFCNKHKDQVAKLIVGDRVAICNECVDLCQSLLVSTKKHKNIRPTSQVNLDPRLIHQYLDQYIVGQPTAKMILSVSIANHYKRIGNTSSECEISKSNILMVGPTGTGKTLMAQCVAKYLDVPFVIADATTLTEAGYVGEDVESLITRLYTASGNDIERTQRGIVFLDEVDKIARKSEGATVSRDVSGEGVQQALLKLIEGTRCKISTQGPRKSGQSDTVEIDTTNILFIVGGAFVGLDNIVKNRKQGTSIGFGAKVQSLDQSQTDSVVPDDLVRYGMIPEFVGRFSSIVNLHSLNKQQLITILTGVKNNLIQQYQWLFSQDGVDLEFDDFSLDLIAERTLSTKTGARGLHTELERVLMPHMYNLHDYRARKILKVVIDKTQVNTPITLVQENQ